MLNTTNGIVSGVANSTVPTATHTLGATVSAFSLSVAIATPICILIAICFTITALDAWPYVFAFFRGKQAVNTSYKEVENPVPGQKRLLKVQPNGGSYEISIDEGVVHRKMNTDDPITYFKIIKAGQPQFVTAHSNEWSISKESNRDVKIFEYWKGGLATAESRKISTLEQELANFRARLAGIQHEEKEHNFGKEVQKIREEQKKSAADATTASMLAQRRGTENNPPDNSAQASK